MSDLAPLIRLPTRLIRPNLTPLAETRGARTLTSGLRCSQTVSGLKRRRAFAYGDQEAERRMSAGLGGPGQAAQSRSAGIGSRPAEPPAIGPAKGTAAAAASGTALTFAPRTK